MDITNYLDDLLLPDCFTIHYVGLERVFISCYHTESMSNFSLHSASQNTPISILYYWFADLSVIDLCFRYFKKTGNSQPKSKNLLMVLSPKPSSPSIRMTGAQCQNRFNAVLSNINIRGVFLIYQKLPHYIRQT